MKIKVCPMCRRKNDSRVLECMACGHSFKGLEMINDPLAKAVKKAYRSSDLFRLEKLLAEESKWKRRQTIANNKLAEVRYQINEFARQLSTPKQEGKPNE